MYDWSEPGDMEVVVEDIESLEFDLLEEWDEQQKDWRFANEECKYDCTNIRDRMTAFLPWKYVHCFSQ